MKRDCPICGSENIDVIEAKELSEKILFDGSAVLFEALSYKCSACEEEFYDENTDTKFELAKDKKINENSLIYLDKLKENFKSISYIERVFGIPQRTIGRWKGGAVTSIAYAFLCLIGKLPWLVEIVEAKFDKNVVAKVLAREAELAVGEIAKVNNYAVTKTITMSSPGKANINYEFNDGKNYPKVASSENPIMEEETKFFSLPGLEAKRV
jgi:YgiT-type zinc finger domain-containing protein